MRGALMQPTAITRPSVATDGKPGDPGNPDDAPNFLNSGAHGAPHYELAVTATGLLA